MEGVIKGLESPWEIHSHLTNQNLLTLKECTNLEFVNQINVIWPWNWFVTSRQRGHTLSTETKATPAGLGRFRPGPLPGPTRLRADKEWTPRSQITELRVVDHIPRPIASRWFFLHHMAVPNKTRKLICICQRRSIEFESQHRQVPRPV